MPNERKPHVLKVKQGIVRVVDDAITKLKGELKAVESTMDDKDIQRRRALAIWIKQRNRLAKDADLPEIPLGSKNNQGALIFRD